MKLTRQQIEEFWNMADRNKDGRLTVQELKWAIKQYDPNLKDNMIAGMFCAFDSDSDDKVTKRELEDQLSNSRGEQLQKLWNQYDKDRSGQLTRGEVIELITDFFGAQKKDEIIGLFLQFCDPNNDKIITRAEYDEFFSCT